MLGAASLTYTLWATLLHQTPQTYSAANANNFRDFGYSHNPDMHTPAYKPITPQQQHTDPSRLRFVGPLRIPASGILVKWRSQCMEYMGSMESKSSIVREQSVKHKIEFTREKVETTNISNISTRPRSIGEVLGGSCIGPCLSGRCTHNEVHDFIIVLAKIVICPWCLWCLLCGYPK